MKTEMPPKQFKIRSGTKFDTIGTQNRIELSHREAKMRIFRIFAFLFIGIAILAMLAAVLHFIGIRNAQSKHYAELKIQLQGLENSIPDTTGSKYERDCHLVRLILFRDEQMIPSASHDEASKLRSANSVARAELEKRNTPPELNPTKTEDGNFICPTTFLDMVMIPAGTFRMGGTLDNEMPAHDVTISAPFWIARTETTNRQMHVLIPGFDAGYWNQHKLNAPDQPAVRVRWDQAVMFCRKLTETERLAGRLPPGYVYRLPTEAEWEYACRAGSSTDYHWGSEFGKIGAEYANVLDKYAADKHSWQLKPIADSADKDAFLVTAPVASLKPNNFGLYDMEGNAAEWCADWYNQHAYTPAPITNPYQKDPVNTPYTQFRNYDAGTWTIETTCRVIRGGSWGVEPKKARCAYRDFMPPNEANTGVGFRIVLAKELPR